jgi:hypothetical protein
MVGGPERQLGLWQRHPIRVLRSSGCVRLALGSFTIGSQQGGRSQDGPAATLVSLDRAYHPNLGARSVMSLGFPSTAGRSAIENGDSRVGASHLPLNEVIIEKRSARRAGPGTELSIQQRKRAAGSEGTYTALDWRPDVGRLHSLRDRNSIHCSECEPRE